MVAYTRCYCRSSLERLVNPAEVVVHEMQSYGVLTIMLERSRKVKGKNTSFT